LNREYFYTNDRFSERNADPPDSYRGYRGESLSRPYRILGFGESPEVQDKDDFDQKG
jgi:hypothetical protein